MRRLVTLGSALAVFVIGTLMLVSYVRGSSTSEPQVALYFVDAPTEAGEAPTVRVQEVPETLALDDAVRAGESFDNLVANVALLPDEQLLRTRLDDRDLVLASQAMALEAELLNQAPALAEPVMPSAVEIPDGQLAVTLRMSADRTAGGRLEPGMRVGVAGSFNVSIASGDLAESPEAAPVSDRPTQTSNILVHNALVVQVQTTQLPTANGSGLAPQGDFLITLAASAYDIERIIFAAEWGSVWLVEEPDGAISRGSRIQSAATIFIDAADGDVGDSLTIDDSASLTGTANSSSSDTDNPDDSADDENPGARRGLDDLPPEGADQ